MTEEFTANEQKLINLIRNSDCPEQAIITAATIIINYLRQSESSEAPSAACLQELS